MRGSQSKWGCHRHSKMGVLECLELMSHSEHCEEAYGALLTLREADSRAGEKALTSDLEAAEKEAQRLLMQEKAAMDGGTLQAPHPRYPREPWVPGEPMSEVLIGELGSQNQSHTGKFHGSYGWHET